MAIPDVRYFGLRSKDFERCQLSDSVKIALNDNDRKRAKQIAELSVVRQEARLAARDREDAARTTSSWKSKSLISKDISYVTEAVRPTAAGRKGLARLAVDIVRNHALLAAAAETFNFFQRPASRTRSSHA